MNTHILFDKNKVDNLDKFEVQNELFKNTFNYKYSDLTSGQKMLYNLFILAGEVDNGGFIQYFQNNQDNYFKGTIQSFKLINDVKTLGIFNKALKIYYKNEDYCSARDLDAELSEEDGLKLEQLDAGFYETSQQRQRLITNYLRNNVEEFFVNSNKKT